MTEKYVKLVDVTKCDGCRACMVACKNWNDLPAEFEEFQGIQSNEGLTDKTWNVITYKEKENKSQNSGLDWLLAHMSCLHCDQAGCEKACPEDAISHSKFGSVVIDYEKCVGCGYCVQACTFDVIKLGMINVNGKKKKVSQKCTLCTDRLEAGLEPACVTACHAESLVFGDRDEILKQAEERLQVVKKRYPNANIYNPSGIKGTTMVYLLADKPSVYGLPDNPKLPASLTVWKDYAQPAGKLMLGATTMAVVSAIVTNKMFNKRSKHEEGGTEHEQTHT